MGKKKRSDAQKVTLKKQETEAQKESAKGFAEEYVKSESQSGGKISKKKKKKTRIQSEDGGDTMKKKRTESQSEGGKQVATIEATEKPAVIIAKPKASKGFAIEQTKSEYEPGEIISKKRKKKKKKTKSQSEDVGDTMKKKRTDSQSEGGEQVATIEATEKPAVSKGFAKEQTESESESGEKISKKQKKKKTKSQSEDGKDTMKKKRTESQSEGGEQAATIEATEKPAKLTYEQKAANAVVIAKPMASKKLAKQCYKLIKTAMKYRHCVRNGVQDVQKSIRQGEKGIVIFAGDVYPLDIMIHLPAVCEIKDIPYCYVPCRADLGNASGIKRGSLMALIKEKQDYKEQFDNLKEKIKCLAVEL